MTVPTSSSPKENSMDIQNDLSYRESSNLLRVAEEDQYDGVRVHITEPMDPTLYASRLQASLSHWKQQGKKGVWIMLPPQVSNLIEPTLKEGFRYHHAERDYVMLVHWIPAHLPDALPANASHTVGIGALVINGWREVLVVKEKNGSFRGIDVWKLPTGLVDQGEDICRAAIREVKEETGVDTEFVEVLAFNQSHGNFCGKSDLFFVCMLRPLSSEINKQDSEIEAAQWMHVDTYAAQGYNQNHESFKYVANICVEKSKELYNGFSAIPCNTTRNDRPLFLYFNKGSQGSIFRILLSRFCIQISRIRMRCYWKSYS